MIGPVVTGREMRRGLQTLLQTWMSSVLAELGRRANEGVAVNEQLFIRPVQAWKRLPNEDLLRIAADQSPAVAVVSNGPVAEPTRDGDGIYSGIWGMEVYVVVRGDSFEETTDLVALYVAAARVAVAQHRIEVEGVKKGKWVGERYREIDTDSSRSVGYGVVAFHIPVNNILDDDAGPAVPPAPPEFADPAEPVIDTASVTVDAL